MKIRMITTERGSVDGCRVQQYEAGQEYDLSATPGAVELAEAFVGAGLAGEVGSRAAQADAPAVTDEPAEAASVEAEAANALPAAPAKPGRKPKAQ